MLPRPSATTGSSRRRRARSTRRRGRTARRRSARSGSGVATSAASRPVATRSAARLLRFIAYDAERTGRHALAEALRHVGVRESPPGSNRTMFGRWFGVDGVPWCAIFVSYCFDVGAGVVLCRGWHGAGVGPRGVAYVPTLSAWLKATGRVGRGAAAGRPRDLRLGRRRCRTTSGSSSALAGDELETVEGNTAVGNDSDGGEVMRRRRSPAQVSLFGRRLAPQPARALGAGQPGSRPDRRRRAKSAAAIANAARPASARRR